MLYLFRHASRPWVKLGFTRQGPWSRVQEGFWTTKHPADLCGDLEPDAMQLVGLWQGDFAVEKLVQSLFPQRTGEWWPVEFQDPIMQMLNLMAEPLPLPQKPLNLMTEPQSAERLPCCGGTVHRCLECGKTFPRSIKLWQHIEDVHRCKRIRCPCGEEQVPRNLKRHQETERCKRARNVI